VSGFGKQEESNPGSVLPLPAETVANDNARPIVRSSAIIYGSLNNHYEILRSGERREISRKTRGSAHLLSANRESGSFPNGTRDSPRADLRPDHLINEFGQPIHHGRQDFVKLRSREGYGPVQFRDIDRRCFAGRQLRLRSFDDVERAVAVVVVDEIFETLKLDGRRVPDGDEFR
jgi:hypothetical protein